VVIKRVISGGQTGVDRAALDWALTHGGWCPAGRMAEDGTIPLQYQLTEMSNGGGYRQRTRASVRDSDATTDRVHRAQACRRQPRDAAFRQAARQAMA
jgi:hypothetical protein